MGREPGDVRGALLFVFVIGLLLRLAYIGQPMRYDESVTYLYFAKLSWTGALSTYTYPNNHILHTLLVKAAVAAFGDSPPVIRLPAFLAGVLVMPATYAAARATYGSRAALVATAIVASSGPLVLYSTNARGYSMIVLAFLLLVMVGARLLAGAAPRHWLTFAAIGALGMWTIPIMLFPFGAVALWLALSLLADGRSAELRRLAAAIAIAAVLTLLLYSPVISGEGGGWAALTRNKFVASSGWYEFLDELPRMARGVLLSWGLGIPPVVSGALALCALVALRRHAAVSRFRVGVPLAAFVWSAWLLAVTHRAPFPRVWIWLVPLAAALAGAGALRLAESRARIRALVEARLPAIAVGFALAAAVSLLVSRAVLLTLDTGTYRDAPDAAAVLARTLGPGDRVLASLPTNAPLAYYFDRAGIPVSALTLDERAAGRVIAVVDQPEGQTLEGVTERSLVRDSTLFAAPTLLARLPSSVLVSFVRRDAAPR